MHLYIERERGGVGWGEMILVENEQIYTNGIMIYMDHSETSFFSFHFTACVCEYLILLNCQIQFEGTMYHTAHCSIDGNLGCFKFSLLYTQCCSEHPFCMHYMNMCNC